MSDNDPNYQTPNWWAFQIKQTLADGRHDRLRIGGRGKPFVQWRYRDDMQRALALVSKRMAAPAKFGHDR